MHWGTLQGRGVNMDKVGQRHIISKATREEDNERGGSTIGVVGEE